MVMERVAHYLEDHSGKIALVLSLRSIGFLSLLQLHGDATMPSPFLCDFSALAYFPSSPASSPLVH